MNFSGLILGLFTIVAIGLGFLWVIKLEYHVGARADKAVFIIGCLVTFASLFAPSPIISAVFGIAGGTIFWGATELKDQERRVKAGMFKANLKKSKQDQKQ